MSKQEAKQVRTRLEEVVPRRAPFVIYLDPCGACNFKCNFCPCNISGERAAERHAVMSWELFEKIAADLDAFEGQVSVINLYGFGEPLLNPRIADMVRVLKENHCCREVRITTNASLLTEEKSWALIEAGVDLVRVSVEAISTEGYQELCGVKIDFSEIVRNIETFYRISVRGGGTSKVSAKIVSAALKTEEDKKRFSEIFSPITNFYYVEEIEPIWSEFEEMKMPSGGLADRCYQAGERREICSMPFTDMCIHSNGIVGACCSDWKFATEYGDVNREHLSEIWNGKRHREFQCAMLARKPIPFCAACMRKPPDRIEEPEILMQKIMKGAAT
ncbi:MAG: radical SAM protein [Oscillibacter sp.]|nr:radical SAM protein [uncultured Oscillibacter sp.]MCI8971856.1 radical SAM protein [Oscillibacter sp.]